MMSGGGAKLSPSCVLFGPEENKSVIAFNHGYPTVAENGFPGPDLMGKLGSSSSSLSHGGLDDSPIIVVQVMSILVIKPLCF